MKTNQKILIGIGILAVVVSVIAYWQFYCSNKFYTLANEELESYKHCVSDSDCKVVGCGQCVNLEGISKYNNLKSYCFREPHWKCLIPEGCNCVNNTCVESVSWQSTKIEPTKEMVEKIVLLENGKKEQIDINSEEGLGIASILTRKLHELNLQSTCVFSKEDIQEIEQKDRSIVLFFKKPIDLTISQWVEPEERYHIPVDEKGYRILEDVETAIFILKDNLDEGLEAHILVGHRVEGIIGYSCWAINIKETGKPELDKTWIDGINRLIK
ncbi:hypothetical protein KAW43_03320 [Candidatus Parcubacteria bacterium]|nr:hypothetical protein [Candidatus Parcubacteria bacterium]